MKKNTSPAAGFIFSSIIYAAVVIFMAVDDLYISLGLIVAFAAGIITAVKTGFWQRALGSINDNTGKMTSYNFV